VQATPPAGSPVAKRLFTREQQHTARNLLTSATPETLRDPTKRADVVQTLEHLGAPPALLDEVSRLR
jgi:hypothetical protein